MYIAGVVIAIYNFYKTWQARPATYEEPEINVPPLAHPIEASQRLRADEVAESDQRRRFQAIAPAVQDGLYRVPKVIE